MRPFLWGEKKLELEKSWRKVGPIYCQPTQKFTLHNGSNMMLCTSLSCIHTAHSAAPPPQIKQPVHPSPPLHTGDLNWEQEHPFLEKGWPLMQGVERTEHTHSHTKRNGATAVTMTAAHRGKQLAELSWAKHLLSWNMKVRCRSNISRAQTPG